MTTRQFQTIFYVIIGLCILTIILSFTSFDFIEVDTAVSWTMKYFALPILIVMTPGCYFIYLRLIRQHETKVYKSKIWTQLRTFFQEWTFFVSKISRQEFPKKHILLKAGQIENYLSFVETGIIRYYIPKLENDLTFTFAFDNSFISGYDSFLTRKPSTYHRETLTKTILWRLKHTDLQDIYNETEIGNLIGRQASEDLFLKKSKRELSLLNETAEQRYLNLFTEQPLLIQHIPLKYIASYIGVTPQALSRIRKRIY